MDNNVAKSVNQGHSCISNLLHTKHQRDSKLFTAGKPLEFFALDILGPLSWTSEADYSVFVMTGKCVKHIGAIPIPTMAATAIACSFFEQWIISFTLSAFVPSDNKTKFVKKTF